MLPAWEIKMLEAELEKLKQEREVKDNCRACNKLDKLEQTLRSILDAERERIGGKR